MGFLGDTGVSTLNFSQKAEQQSCHPFLCTEKMEGLNISPSSLDFLGVSIDRKAKVVTFCFSRILCIPKLHFEKNQSPPVGTFNAIWKTQ